MKTVNIEISGARSLEHAMDQAIEQAEGKCYSGASASTYRLKQVTFKTLVAECSYMDKNFIYHFEADLEEV